MREPFAKARRFPTDEGKNDFLTIFLMSFLPCVCVRACVCVCVQSSVQSLNRFAEQVNLEKDAKERSAYARKRDAENVIKTNASLLSTEVTLLLRSYAVEQNHVDQVKSSINEFVRTVFQQMDQVLP